MKKAVLAYVPVIHSGYIEFLKKYPYPLYLVGKEIVQELSKKKPYYLRDIRAVDPKIISEIIGGLNIVPEVFLLDLKNLSELKNLEIIAPDEDITRDIVSKYFPKKKIKFVNVFLRWDKLISKKELEVSPDRIISTDKFHKDFLKKAETEASKSPDWWRQVGAVIVKNGKIVLSAYNKHLPSDSSPYSLGDPRNNFNAGERIDLCTSIHAEADLVARAAKDGNNLDGSSVYVTTFPCPNCARLIARAGIKKVYYSKGYSILDAEQIFKTFKIEVVLVK